jgi:hypothetical protein
MLMKVTRSNPLKVIQMKTEDFKDFSAIACEGKYVKVPFTKVKSLVLKQNEPKVLSYKSRFGNDWVTENVLERKVTRKAKDNLHFEVCDPLIAKPTSCLSQAKKDDIRDMLHFMPLIHKECMANLVV